MSKYKEVSRKLQALFGDPFRMEILEYLLQNSQGSNPTEMIKALIGETDEPKAVSKMSSHLSVLVRNNIILSNRDGRFINYKINPEIIEKGKFKISNITIQIN